MNSILITLSLILAPSADASETSTDAILTSTVNTQGASAISASTSIFIIAETSMTLLGPYGYLSSPSSITASAFFGNGQNLDGIATLSANQSFTGIVTFDSGIAVQSGGKRVSLSTSTTTDNLSINSWGATTLYPELHNSSSTTISSFTTTNAYCDSCMAGSTITITTTGGRVEVSLTATIGNNDRSAALNFLQDGQFVGNLGRDGVLAKAIWHTTEFANVVIHYLIDAPSHGSHSYCASLCTNSSAAPTASALLLNDSTHANIFFVKEIK